MKILLTTCIALVVAMLAGCAGASADIDAFNASQPLRGALTWRFTNASPQDVAASARDAGPDRAHYEARVRAALAAHGFSEGGVQGASGTQDTHDAQNTHYLVSVSYDTLPARVGVTDAACRSAPQDCAASAARRASSGAYRHSLTLRFFEMPGGGEIYGVRVVKTDDDARPEDAMPALVAAAFARFPYIGVRSWRAQFGDDGQRVVSVEPVAW